MTSPVDTISAATQDLREQLVNHRLYHSISDRQQLQIFMSHHVFAVFDFMWLLKRLQNDLSAMTVPWLPPSDPELTRFVNEIVLSEETDQDGLGSYCSHFELYLEAMKDVDAPLSSIISFVNSLRSRQPFEKAVQVTAMPESVRQFVTLTYQLASQGTASEVAAAFCFGREDVIPEMFQRLLAGFEASRLSVPRLKYYIERHIELDADQHGPLTRKLVDRICGQSEKSIQEAIQAARAAMTSRLRLWDGVLAALGKLQSVPA